MGKYEATAQIDASAEEIWRLVSDGNQLTTWLKPVRGVDSVDPPGPLAKGSQVEATVGNLGGAKLKFKEAERDRTLYWSAGPFMLHMTHMPMSVRLELEPQGEKTQATLTFKTNPMVAPMMKMLVGLNFAEEAPATVSKLKQAVEAA